jgi:hypothetical protein
VAADNDSTPDKAEQGAWGRPVSVRLGELAMAAALLAAGIFFVWHAALLPFGRVGLPGPGFFPFVLGIALALFAVALLLRSARKHFAASEVVYLGHRDVLVVLAALMCVGLAFERFGTYATLGLFAAVLLLVIARAPFWQVIAGASLGMVAVWALFKVLLGVQLPQGPF